MASIAQNQLNAHGYSLVNVEDFKASLREPRSSDYAIIALCSDGSVDYEFNMEKMHVEAGMRICYHHVVQTRMLHCTSDCRMKALVLDNAFMLDCTVGIETNFIQDVFESPLAEVQEPQVLSALNTMFDLLENLLHFPVNISTRQVSMNLVRSVLLLLCELEANRTQSTRAPYTMADTYFRRFIRLVAEHFKTEHEVSFYAKQLHITPKYLSEICKQKTQRKAKEIISGILLRKLKGDLMNSGKSMKIIADEYGFADQSSLGKFFRKMTGLSPRHYKQCQFGTRKMSADDETTE